MIALGIAAALWPAETLNNSVATQQQSEVTTFDALNAAQSLYSDVISFCDRNEETCNTTKAITSNAVNSIKGGLNDLATKSETASPSLGVDETKTASTPK